MNQLDRLHNDAREVLMTLEMLDEKARAVIAAGRPHTSRPFTMLGEKPHICPCPQCAAWDELKALLEKGEA